MIKVEHAGVADLDFFSPCSEIPDFREQMEINFLDPTKDIVSLTLASGKVIAFIGINHLRCGVAEAWLVRGKGLENHKKGFYRCLKKLTEFVINKMELHRLELAISKETPFGHKWAERLGFKYEHTEEAYDLNYTDHDIFVRITKWQKQPQ